MEFNLNLNRSEIMDFLLSFVSVPLFLVGLVAIIISKAIKFVPQQHIYVVERFGQYVRSMEGGLGFVVPFIERVAYDRTLKEEAIEIPGQAAITKDNIELQVDGVLYIKVIDAKKACYGVENYRYTVEQLAQTTMRAELGKMKLDQTFRERETINTNVVSAINEASEAWGVQVLRYEAKDINPPASVKDAMEKEMTAEREKRATILESEAEKESAINVAQGDKESKILKAQGEAEKITIEADAKAKAIKTVGDAVSSPEGMQAARIELANEAIRVRQNLAKETNTVILPDSAGDPNSIVASAMSVIEAVKSTQGS